VKKTIKLLIAVISFALSVAINAEEAKSFRYDTASDSQIIIRDLGLTINGNQAQLSINNPALGEHTIELTKPAGCFPPAVPSCD